MRKYPTVMMGLSILFSALSVLASQTLQLFYLVHTQNCYAFMLDWPIYHHSNTMFPCLLKIIKLINLFLITLSPCCWPALSVVVSWGYSSLLCMGFLLQWLLLFWSTGSRSRASVFVMHVLSCFVAYGIFLEQRLNQCPLHWQGILSH